MDAIYEFFAARPMTFTLAIEGLSLLVIAPLTARLVAWQNDRKWRPARRALVADVISDAFTLVRGLEIFLQMVPKRDTYVQESKDAFARVMTLESATGFEFEADDDAFEIRHPATYETILIESPKRLLARSITATNVLATFETTASRLEDRLSRYGFCFSPEMVLTIAQMFSLRQAAKKQRIRINAHDTGGSDTVFLRDVSASAKSLRTFVDYWRSHCDNLDVAIVRETLIRHLRAATDFDLPVLAAQIETLMKHVQLSIKDDLSTKKAIETLADPGANDAFRASVEGFTSLLATFEPLQAEFADMRASVIARFRS